MNSSNPYKNHAKRAKLEGLNLLLLCASIVFFVLLFTSGVFTDSVYAQQTNQVTTSTTRTNLKNALELYDQSKDKKHLLESLFTIEKQWLLNVQNSISQDAKIISLITNRLSELDSLLAELKNITKEVDLSKFVQKVQTLRKAFRISFKEALTEFLTIQGNKAIDAVKSAIATAESKIQELRSVGIDTREVESKVSSVKKGLEKANTFLQNKNFAVAGSGLKRIVAVLKNVFGEINSLAGTVPTAAIHVSPIPTQDVTTTQTSPSVPQEYSLLYSKLESKLKTFETKVDSMWDKSKHPVVFSAQIFTANSNNGPSLIQAQNYTSSLTLLDRLEDLGVRGVTVELNFPLLTPGFLDEQTRLQYLDFYKKLSSEIKKRGLVFSIESQAIFSAFSALPVAPYYEGLTFDQYKQGRLETFKVIAAELKPDYLTIANEPDTEVANTGQTALKDVNTYVATLTFYIDGLKNAGITNIKLGGGFGTWQKDYQTWATKFSTETDLDFINIHIYPVDADLLDRALTISDIARKNGKKLALQEAWLYKWQIGESSGDIAASAAIYGRDVFSFWQPLDQKFLEVLVKLAHYKKFDYISAFWSNYFFAYFDYEDVKNTPLPKLGQVLKEGLMGAQAGKTTQTGLFYKQIITAP